MLRESVRLFARSPVHGGKKPVAGARSQHITCSQLCLGVCEQANTETRLKHRVGLENPFACLLVRPFSEEKRLWMEQGPNIDPVTIVLRCL